MIKLLNARMAADSRAESSTQSARINEAGIQTADGKLSDFFFKESIPTAEAGAAGAKPSDEVKNQLF